MGIKWEDVDIMVTALSNQICLCKSKPVPEGAPDARIATDKSGDKTEKCVKAVMQYMLNCCKEEGAFAKSFIIPSVCRLELTDLENMPDNRPLTMKEMLEMDGMPVWWEDIKGRSGWGIVSIEAEDRIVYIVSTEIGTFAAFVYGEPNSHLALKLYRWKPERQEYEK